MRVEEHRDDGTRHREDRVPTEEPLEIQVAMPGRPPERLWVTMRTPGHDFELAAGYAFCEGVLEPHDLVRVSYCTDAALAPGAEFNVVTLATRRAVELPQRHGGHSSGSSACGVCGKSTIEEILTVRRRAGWSQPPLTAEFVRRFPSALRDQQPLFARTGGVHAAALADADGRLTEIREDVGRHNAVDKVVGARVLSGTPVPAAALVVSGRAGFELVQKAVASGMGALVAVGAPTSLAVSLAASAAMPLWGFTSQERAVRYA